MLTKPPFPRQNNLDWLRLVFAIQVVVMHSGEHLGLNVPLWVSAFPGVPAFFFVSGLLIYASFKSSPSSYWVNRFLRLFPGLITVTIAGLAVLLFAKGISDLLAWPKLYAIWFVAQISLGQAFNPDHFRDVGVGVINGALWTITVELLFYMAVPILVLLERRIKHVVLIAGAASFAFYAIAPGAFAGRVLHGKPLIDYFFLTPIFWGWIFVLGIEANRHWDRIRPFIPYCWIMIVPIALLHLFGSGRLFNGTGQQVGLAFMVCYAGLILFVVFGIRHLPIKADFSYGIYIWHMPMINLLLVLGLAIIPLAWSLVAVAAILSWYLIEQPFLRLKPKSIKPEPAPDGEPAMENLAPIS
jgi:peptidoglycan/LPS O-acetylase OafA/YrhL